MHSDDNDDDDFDEDVTQPGGLAVVPPPAPDDVGDPAMQESYVRAAVHRDRSPGAVLAVCHPLRMHKVPRGLFEALESEGFSVHVVETLPDRVASVQRIRDALQTLGAEDRPLDILLFSGDGSLDHHVLVAAFAAFYPDLVAQREGEISATEPSEEEWARLDPEVRSVLSPLPDGAGLEPDEATIHRLWVLRATVDKLLRRGKGLARVAVKTEMSLSDPVLRLAILAAVLPTRVHLRAHGFDLAELATASREQAFQGLYPFVRSIACYPAGTAADNALYAGIPGWTYAQWAGWLGMAPVLEGLRRRWEERSVRRFLDAFLQGIVVPARFSMVAFDGDWQVLSSHAVGGPAGGRFFSADLESKTSGLLGYLARIPSVVLGEGLFGSTVVRVRAVGPEGETRLETEGRLVEGLFTNRAFIAGVGSVPSTNPTSFAGSSSLVLGPPLWYRDGDGRLVADLSGLMSFVESITKGVLGRALHLLGLGAGRLAGGGRFAFATPENQITLMEGEAVHIDYLDLDRRPRFVPAQVSGDPFQTTTLTVRVAWGPLPLLAAPGSLLLAAAQRALTRLRHLQSWDLQTVYIGGVPFYRHRVGEGPSDVLPPPPRTLPGRLDRALRVLVRRWERAGLGSFVDTSEQGLAVRRVRQAHNSDHTAHVVLLRDRGTLLVRQIRRTRNQEILEGRTTYRVGWGGWIIHDRQVRCFRDDDPAVIVEEEHYFRDADGLRLEAPGFFPFVDGSGGARPLPDVKEADVDPEAEAR
ncbi:MAG: hypothetical protein KTR31_20695 [Myxococcales bacterium]|nr:hypothetical protein [Myxococcales bacterium]